MKQFSSDLRNVEEVFKNEYESIDKGKNFFIPIYQRDFTWSFKEIEKLIKDIDDVLNEKTDTTYRQYFIGGIVLCRDSIFEESRSNISLEVIDGQQRLTSISIILVSLYQQLKHTNRDFGIKKEFVEKLIERILPLLKYEKSNNITFEVTSMYRVERSDDLKKIYEKIVDNLIEHNVQSILKFKNDIQDEKTTNKFKYQSNFIDIVHKVNKIFIDFNNDRLISFTLQLLENTFLVVTKSIDIDTGFLVFEKLNDNGKQLEPNDLLKNFLFSEAKKEEYEDIDSGWKIFISQLESTNNKITPKEFLELYLVSQGHQFSRSKDKLFTLLKEKVYLKNKMSSTSMLNDLKKTAIEYSSLRDNPIIHKYLSLIGFKLGYLVFLSIYKKVNSNSYEEHLLDILIQVIRLGFVYIITDYSKLLSNKVPEICETMNSLDSNDITEILLTLKNRINKEVEYLKDEFEETIKNSNLFTRRQNLTKFLLNIINYEMNGFKFNELSKTLSLARILPLPDKFEDFKFDDFQGITFDNIKSISNQIGNITLVKNLTEEELEVYNFNKRITQIKDNNSRYFIKKNKIIDLDFSSWNLKKIETRNIEFSNKSISSIIEGNINVDFFKDEYFYIDIAKNKNAIMIQEEEKFKVLKGSICNSSSVDYDWSYSDLRSDLIKSNKLKKESDDAYIFTEDYTFDSLSAAASIIEARQSPGPEVWKDIHDTSFKRK